MSRNPVTIEALTADPEYQKLLATQTKERQRIQGKLDKVGTYDWLWDRDKLKQHFSIDGAQRPFRLEVKCT